MTLWYLLILKKYTMKPSYKVIYANRDYYNVLKITIDEKNNEFEKLVFSGNIVECYCFVKLIEDNYLIEVKK